MKSTKDGTRCRAVPDSTSRCAFFAEAAGDQKISPHKEEAFQLKLSRNQAQTCGTAFARCFPNETRSCGPVPSSGGDLFVSVADGFDAHFLRNHKAGVVIIAFEFGWATSQKSKGHCGLRDDVAQIVQCLGDVPLC